MKYCGGLTRSDVTLLARRQENQSTPSVSQPYVCKYESKRHVTYLVNALKSITILAVTERSSTSTASALLSIYVHVYKHVFNVSPCFLRLHSSGMWSRVFRWLVSTFQRNQLLPSSRLQSWWALLATMTTSNLAHFSLFRCLDGIKMWQHRSLSWVADELGTVLKLLTVIHVRVLSRYRNRVYTITLGDFVVPTCSVW